LKLAKRSGTPFEEKAPRPRDLERQQRTGPAEVYQIQTVGPEAWSDGHIQAVEIGGAIAPYSNIDVALRYGPPLDRGAKEDKKLEIRHRSRKFGEMLSDEFWGQRRPHAANVPERYQRVKEGG